MDGKSSNWRPGPSVCRCCLSDGCYKDIATEYFWMGKREVYEEMLVDTLGLTISFGDSNAQHSQSRLICETCISRLRNATDFKKQVKECEQTFLQYLNPSTLDVVEDVISLEKEEKQVTVKEEKSPDHGDDFNDNNDFLDDDNDDELDDQPLMNLATKVPKKESVDVFDLLDNAKPLVKRKSTTKAKTTSSKKAKIKETKTKPKEKPEKKKKGEIDIDLDTEICETRKENHRKIIDVDIIKARKKNAITLLEFSRICPFKWRFHNYFCFYCEKRFVDPAVLRQHNFIEHNNMTYNDIKSALSKLKKKHDMLKVDITDIGCKLCNTIMKDFSSLKIHLCEAHKKIVSSEDGLLPFKVTKDTFDCVLCTEKFSEFKTLNQHMNIHYKNFICDQCGTGFITPGRLRTHTFSHEAGSYPCNSCDKVFRSMYSKNEHYATVHKQVKRHRCPHCQETFRNYFQRNKHVSSVHGMKIKEFKCASCTKVFSSSGKLGVHVRTVHLKMKRHACDLCEWKFYSKSELKEHMVRHSGERKYHCGVCKKAFARKYTLREHTRIHDNDRRFVCSLCGGSFIQKCSLKHHIKVNHPTVKIEGFSSTIP
ncbi:PR domain zinc finger protein 5-like isoform X5 [Leptidea sinapis]|uniref:PR domain zinc finger protein 5-like isoform X5 n=1 Tax=Leptidea sinapis TaxID=189913 RepID=UPI0021C333F8|nr:PR domain zinc finger protein 5-like isoform X5 [Leptidea sinapis]